MYSPENKAILDRLSRAEGQIRALREQLTEDGEKDCKAFIAQIKAARSALRSASNAYVKHHIQLCQQLPAKERDEQITEAISLLSQE